LREYRSISRSFDPHQRHAGLRHLNHPHHSKRDLRNTLPSKRMDEIVNPYDGVSVHSSNFSFDTYNQEKNVMKTTDLRRLRNRDYFAW
jgi:hypothetical protein